ncbi:MAG: ABC transporter substrate-binding protein [Burkholderiaceae bacterium]
MKVVRTAIRTAWIVTAFCAATWIAPPAEGKTLRWAARGDVLTMDPYTTDESVSANFANLIHDALVDRDRAMAIVPRLATSWKTIDDTTWRFTLRNGVRFHDGSPFTADDVVFSIERAQHPKSAYAQYARAIGKAIRIDDTTIELKQDKPDPLLLEHLSEISIMSRAWSIAHHAETPLDLKATEEPYVARHANGTGPYLLKSREPGVKTVLVRNPEWWGAPEGNVTEVVYTPIASDATRVAALLSGALDLVQDPPPQDLARFQRDDAFRITSGPENRIIFLGMDQHRSALEGSDIVDRNPFKDRRVREALSKAIDVAALSSKIMRGQSIPTGCMATSPAGCPDPTLERIQPVDIAGSSRLLGEAGYPNGFSVTLDCPNDRYINDRDLCVAIAGMLARIGVRARVDALPKALYFPKLSRTDTSFYLHGWGGSITDAQDVLDAILHSTNPASSKGSINYGRTTDPALDRLIDAAGIEMDPVRRKRLLVDAMALAAREHHYIVLHRQKLTWVSRKNVVPVLLPSNIVRVEWIRID